MINNMKNELTERIEGAIEDKQIRYGFMGDETVSITLILTDEEIEAFQEIELDEDHYAFEINGNEVNISYAEER